MAEGVTYSTILSFDVFTPPGTPKANPQFTPFGFDYVHVNHIEIYVPGGHVGRTGIQIVYGIQPIIPENNNGWLRGNNRWFRWDIEDYPTGSQWAAMTYNTGSITHHHMIHILGNPPNVLGAQPL